MHPVYIGRRQCRIDAEATAPGPLRDPGHWPTHCPVMTVRTGRFGPRNFVRAPTSHATMRFLLIAVLAVGALPAAADAATVSRAGGTLRYEAAKGERVSGSITETSGGAFLVRMAKQPHQPR